MSNKIDFENVSLAGLESSPVSKSLAGLRANESRYFKNKYNHDFTVSPASKSKDILDYVNKKRAVGFKLSEGMEVPKELEKKFKFARQKSKLAGIIRGSFFVIKGEY